MQGNSHFLILSNFIAKSFDIVSIQKSNIIINKKLKISFAAKVAIRACGLGSKITTTRGGWGPLFLLNRRTVDVHQAQIAQKK